MHVKANYSKGHVRYDLAQHVLTVLTNMALTYDFCIKYS